MDADLYQDNNRIELETALIAFEKYGSKIKWKETNNKICDVGCAEGTVTSRIKKYFPPESQILACDINERMIELAKEKYCDGQISFTVLDIAGNLPHNMKERYSHVVSFYCLNWVINQQKAFNNIYDLLEPDGECFLLIVHYSAIFDVYRKFAQSNKWNKWVYDVERYISPYCDSQEPSKEIKVFMENSGFDNIDIEHDHMFYTYDDMETMKGSLLALCPFKIPNEKLDDFWKDYVKELRLLKGCDDSIKNIKYYFKLITVHAHKPMDMAKN